MLSQQVLMLIPFSGLDDCDDVLPIYVGDDRTDEDAFKVKYQFLLRWKCLILDFSFGILFTYHKNIMNFYQVVREKNRGYGILVSSVPKESSAFYSLRDPSEVPNT